MKTLPFLILFSPLILSPLCEGADEEINASQSLKLADGTVLRGTQEGFDDEGRLMWRSSTLVEPVSVLRAKILEMRLLGNPAPKQDSNHRAFVHLTNGDVLQGQLEGVTDTHVLLETWYGGILNLQRTMISGIDVEQIEGTLYSGPRDFGSWRKDGNPGAWKLSSGALLSSRGAAIARELPSPDKFHLSLVIRWRNSLRCRLLLCSDDGATTQPDNCYDFVCQRRFVYLRKRWMTKESGGSRIVGQANVAALAEKETARFDFYIDRESGTIAFYVNGVNSNVWTDADPKVGNFGKWFHIVSEDFYPLDISRIRLSKWDGELPPNAMAKEENPVEKKEGDHVRLRDRTLVAGKLKAIEKGFLHLQSKTGDVNWPIDQISSIVLSRDEYQEPKRKRGDIRAWPPDGGRITFRLDSISKETLKGHSENFGEAEFNLKAFTRLEFNIYDESLEKLRDGKP